MVMTCEDIGTKVMSLCVAREMVVPMAMEAKAAREVVVNQHCHDYRGFHGSHYHHGHHSYQPTLS